MSKKGYIYFIVDYEKGEVKIGYSTNPTERLKGIKTSNSGKLEIAKVIPGTRKDEKKYHMLFCHSHKRREWFTLTPEIQEFIKRKAA